MHRWLWTVALLAGLATAQAQSAPRVEVYSAYTDNVFGTYQAQSDWMNFAYIDLDVALTQTTDLFYSGSASVYTDNDDLASATQRLGLSRYLHYDDEMWVTGAVDASLRLNRTSYDFRDYMQGRGVVQMRYRPLNAPWVLRGTYETRLQEYTQSTDYSFWENRVQGRWSRTLRPGTSLQLRAEVGTKSYLREAEPGLLTELLFGSTTRERHLLQWESGVRIGQSLTDWAGLQLVASRRQNLGGSGRFDSGLLDTDDDLFDDRFSHEGQSLGAHLKMLGPPGSQLSLGAQLEDRDFIDRVAYDLEGYSLGSTRSDRQVLLSLGLQKTFWLDSGWMSEIIVDFDLKRHDVDSNDPYYDATTHTATTGIQIAF